MLSLWAPVMAISLWFPLWTQIRALKGKFQLSCQKREAETAKGRKRVIRGYFHVLFDKSFVLILVQFHSVWLCSCRHHVSGGLPWEAVMIHSLFLSMLSYLSCFWCWFCYPSLCMLLVIMPIERVIPKAEEIEEELNWRSVAVGKKKQQLFLWFFPPAVYLRTFQSENKTLNLSTCLFFPVVFFSFPAFSVRGVPGSKWLLPNFRGGWGGGGLNKIVPCNFAVQLTQSSKSMIRLSVAFWVQIHTEPRVLTCRLKY